MQFEDNPSPYVTFVEQAAADVAAPAAGKQKTFIDSADHKYKRKNSSGTVTQIENAGDVVGPSSAVDSRIACFDGTTGKLLKDGGSTIASITAGAMSSSIYVNVQHQEAQNTNGGTFTSGAWRTRPLNTEVSDVGSLCSLASNQMTLAAGTYVIAATALGYSCNRHQLRLQNVTDNATVLKGMSHFNSTTVSADSEASLRGIFTIAASKALELQHQCETTQTTNGFGVASNFTTEVYAIVELWKVG